MIRLLTVTCAFVAKGLGRVRSIHPVMGKRCLAIVPLFFVLLVSCQKEQKAALVAERPHLWRDPGNIEKVDFTEPGGLSKQIPISPFEFIREESGGTSPKILIRDRAGVQWRMKGGLETKSENFATRLVGALGYYVEPMVYIKAGTVLGVKQLERAHGFVQSDGAFANASFERADTTQKYLQDRDWAWNDNPFTGTRPLQGLKLLVMLLSNWDNKDVRDKGMGSNTGIIERHVSGRAQWVYFVNDWGQTLGAWGKELKPKQWDCDTFTQQTSLFVRGREGRLVRFGFEGQHAESFKSDITIDDVEWLLRYLGRITDAQLRDGLQASGATADETECFTRSLRDRISQLHRVSR